MAGIDQYTKALLHFDGNLKDEITQENWLENGVGFSSDKKKFGSHSLCFDGSTHAYIQALINSNFNFGTSDFTIDWWEYRLDTNDGRPTITLESSPTDSSSYNAAFSTWHDGSLPRLYISSNGNSWDISNYAQLGTNLSKQWVHRAIVRYNTTFYLFENGTIITTFTSSSSLYYNSNYYFVLGGRNNTYFKGFIDELRISNIARWTENFTTQVLEYVVDNNTLALLHFNNSLIDEKGLLTWESPSSLIQYSNNIKKFNNKSLYLSSNSYIYKFINSNFDLGISDFTIDWWEYLIDSNGNPIFCIQVDNTNSGKRGASILTGLNQDSHRWNLMASGTSEWDISGEGNNAWLGDILINQWVHRAVSKKNGTFYYFQNGQLYNTFYSPASLYWNENYFMTIGSRSNNYLNGYLAEFRISVGIARWTENFIPPTSEYTAPTNISESGYIDIYKQITALEFNHVDLSKTVYFYNYKNLDISKSIRLKESSMIDLIKLSSPEYSIIKGTIIASEVRANSDSIPSLYANELLGGYQIANTITTKNSIPYLRRTLGMKCMVLSDNNTYILINNPTTNTTKDSDWQVEIIKSTDLALNDITVETAIDNILNNANTRYIKFSIPTNSSVDINDEFVLPFNCNITSLNINISTNYILSDMINAQLEKYNTNTKSWDIILVTYITRDNAINNKTTVLSTPYSLIIGDRIRVNITNIQNNIIILNSILSILLTE